MSVRRVHKLKNIVYGKTKDIYNFVCGGKSNPLKDFKEYSAYADEVTCPGCKELISEATKRTKCFNLIVKGDKKRGFRLVSPKVKKAVRSKKDERYPRTVGEYWGEY